MIRLFYISKAASGLTREDHERILVASRRNNRRTGITGLLVAKGQYFAQALEGEVDAVMETVAKIQADPRHSGVVVLSKSEVVERIFPAWDMGYRDLESLSSPLLQKVELDNARFVSNPEELSLVFRSFIENEAAVT